MFKLSLHYPQDSAAKGAVREVRSSYIPPIGMEIYDDRSAAYVVTGVLAGVEDGILDDKINVLLEVKKS